MRRQQIDPIFLEIPALKIQADAGASGIAKTGLLTSVQATVMFLLKQDFFLWFSP
jgi:hypothetical protein